MRDIKFKVWCKENEQFIQFNKMGFLEDGSLWYVQEVDENEPPYFENQNNWELMQCTGLKDKNGTEVYINDIVEDEYGRRYEIVFEGDCLRCNGVRRKKGGHKPKNRWFGKGLKVIGNRYENPELLKEE